MTHQKFLFRYTNCQCIAALAGLFESARMFTGAINVVFLLHRGVNLKQLATLQFIFTATAFVMEIPTGVVSDKNGKKLAAILGCLITSLFYLLCLAAPIMSWLIIAEIVLAIGLSFTSGSFEAWIVSATRLEYPNNHLKINHLGHLRKEIAGLGNMISGPLGAFLAFKFGYTVVYLISFLSILAVAVCLFFRDELKNQHKATTKNFNFDDLKKSRLSKGFFLYTGIAILLSAVYQPMYHFWQPLFEKALSSSNYVPNFLQNHFATLGLTFFCSNGVVFICNNYIKRKMIFYSNPFLIAIGITILSAIAFTILGQNNSKSIIFLLFVFSVLHGLLSSLFTIADDQFFKIIRQKSFL